MRIVSFDCESHLIRLGCITPRMVCLTYAERVTVSDGACVDGPNQIEEVKDGISKGLASRAYGIDLVREWLEDDGVILVGHNIWFDLGICVAADPSLLPLVFRKLDLGLVRDTQVRQQLIDIATGSMKFVEDEDTGEITKTTYHLDDLSLRLLKKWLKKKDTWRLKYALLDGVPLTEWPEEAKRYAIEDAVTTLKIYEAQDVIAGVAPGPDGAAPTCTEIPNAAEQHRAAWALHLMSAWGVRTDGVMVAELKKKLEAEYDDFTERLRPSGFLKFIPARALKSGPRKGLVVPAEISKNMAVIKARVEAEFSSRGEATPRTDASDKYPEGQISTSKKTLLASADPELKTLAERGATAKLVETYIPILERGTRLPINARFNVLVETGRTSCSSPNLQNSPRKNGVRDCYIPRDGWVYASADYSTIELCALSQVCLDLLGYSEMAEVLRRGEDLHLSLAADMLGISYEEGLKRKDAGDNEISEYRQLAKIQNFGLPGGLGANTFVDFALGFGVVIELEKSKWLKEAWFKRWPEMKAYFELVAAQVEGEGAITQLRSGRVRGGASFCAAANGYFQALAADGAKEALWRVAKECYVITTSPLFGCRPVMFIHDEVVMEVPLKAWGYKRTAAAAEHLATVMIDSMRGRWIPDVPILCKPVITRRLLKGAEPVKVEIDGETILVPSKPVKTDKRTTWVADIA